MVPGFIMWLLGVPLVVVVLLYLFHVIEPARAAWVLSLVHWSDRCGAYASERHPLSPLPVAVAG